jgi:hypothetical protein
MKQLQTGFLLFLAVGMVFAFPAKSADVATRLQNGQSLTVDAIGTSLTGRSPGYQWLDARKSLTWSVGTWFESGNGTVTRYNDGIGATASSYGPGSAKTDGGGGAVQLPTALAHNPEVVLIEFGVNDAFLPSKLDAGTSMALRHPDR